MILYVPCVALTASSEEMSSLSHVTRFYVRAVPARSVLMAW
jgi:hypothetical protein